MYSTVRRLPAADYRFSIRSLPVPALAYPGWLERVVVTIALLLYAGAFLNTITGQIAPEEDPAAGTWQLQVVWGALYLIAAYLVLRKKGWLQLLFREWTVLAIIVLSGLSVVWSAAPDITLRRTVALIGTVFIALYLSRRYTITGQLKLLGDTLLLAALASIVFSVFGIGVPVQAFGDASWFGVFLHKNALGRMMALGVIVLVLLSKSGNTQHRLLGAGLCGLLVLLSRSITAVVVLAGLMGLSFVLNSKLGHKLKTSIAVFVAVAMVLWFALATLGYAGEGLKAAGKDETLSGRTELWQASLSAASEHPLLGYGYSAFWLGEEGPSYEVWKQVNWSAPHSHNGFIDLGLELGWVGVGLFLLGIIMQLHRAGILRKYLKPAEGVWPFIFLAFLILSNITESGLLRAHSLVFLLYCTLGFSLSRLMESHRLAVKNGVLPE
jgi:O-antigen ligase